MQPLAQVEDSTQASAWLALSGVQDGVVRVISNDFGEEPQGWMEEGVSKKPQLKTERSFVHFFCHSLTDVACYVQLLTRL